MQVVRTSGGSEHDRPRVGSGVGDRETVLDSLSVASRILQDARNGLRSHYHDVLILAFVPGAIVFVLGLLFLALPDVTLAGIWVSDSAATAISAVLAALAFAGLVWTTRSHFKPRFREYDEWNRELELASLIASNEHPPEALQTSVLETLLRAGGSIPRWLADARSLRYAWKRPVWELVFFPFGSVMTLLTYLWIVGLMIGLSLLGNGLLMLYARQIQPGMVTLAAGGMIVGLLVYLYRRDRVKMKEEENRLMTDWRERMSKVLAELDLWTGDE